MHLISLAQHRTSRSGTERPLAGGPAWVVAALIALTTWPAVSHAQEGDAPAADSEPAAESDSDDASDSEDTSNSEKGADSQTAESDSETDAEKTANEETESAPQTRSDSSDTSRSSDRSDAPDRSDSSDTSTSSDKSDSSDDSEAKSESDDTVDPSLMHAPVGDADAGKKLSVSAAIDGDWHLDETFLAVRPVTSDDADDWETYPFERADSNTFMAEIPGGTVQPPGLEYYIASKTEQGRRLHYASPDQPHPIVVHGETDKTRTQSRLARHGGYRSTFELRGELSQYGGRVADPEELPSDVNSEDVVTEPFTDQYWKIELEYTYRVLKALYDIRFGLGVMRGTYPEADVGSRTITVSRADESASPGLNYGYGMATFELSRNFSFSGKLMLGASSQGFAPGAGAILRIGRLGGTRAEIGVDLMADVGSNRYFAFRWDTVPRVPMGFIVELSDWPAGGDNPTGSRIIYEMGVEITDPLEAGLRAGVATRRSGTSSGFVGGLHLSYSL